MYIENRIYDLHHLLLAIYNHHSIWITICKKCEKVKDFSVNTHNNNVKLTKHDILFLSLIHCFFS